jgi:hypothetical protein
VNRFSYSSESEYVHLWTRKLIKKQISFVKRDLITPRIGVWQLEKAGFIGIVMRRSIAISIQSPAKQKTGKENLDPSTSVYFHIKIEHKIAEKQ